MFWFYISFIVHRQSDFLIECFFHSVETLGFGCVRLWLSVENTYLARTKVMCDGVVARDINNAVSMTADSRTHVVHPTDNINASLTLRP